MARNEGSEGVEPPGSIALYCWIPPGSFADNSEEKLLARARVGGRGAERPSERRGRVAVEFPNRRIATDLTTVHTKEDGVVAVVPVIDCGCRSGLALVVTKAQTAPAVLGPVREALFAAFGSPEDVPDGVELLTDHGTQYTADD